MAAKLMLVAAATLVLAGCSSGSGPGLSADQRDGLAPTRAAMSVLQFVIDTGATPRPDVEKRPSAVADGVVVTNVESRLLYQMEATRYLGPARTTSVGSEAERATGVIQLVPGLQGSKGRPEGKPELTADRAAAAVVVQELADAGYVDGQVFGAPGKGGVIEPGAAVDAWVAAHGADPLVPGAVTTVATEKQRVLGLLLLPLPSPSAG
ncbi:MAG: hypothetical protein HOV87_02920 [Catenulispora sp.]|nr:hypothetical protein [Catenulispora sp.]